MPARDGKGLHKALDWIYGHRAGCPACLAKSEEEPSPGPFDRDAFDKAVERIRESGTPEPGELLEVTEYSNLVRASYKEFSKAIADGVAAAKITMEIPASLVSSLRDNVWVFSGMKTFRELREASSLLVGPDGNPRSFHEFKAEIDNLYNEYNINYLRAEYGFAAHSSRMAAKWAEWEEDGEDYLLQYRTAGDDRVRASHAALRDTTLPPSDPFWDSYLPPLDWGCRCTTVQVLREDYPSGDSAAAIEKGEAATTNIGKDGVNKLAMFRFNPGKTGRIFPEQHPYFARPSSPEAVKMAQKLMEYSLENDIRHLKRWAKDNIQGMEVINDSNGMSIKITGKGIKEYLNQPHKNYSAKNQLIKNLPEVLKSSESMGFTEHKGRISRIFKTSIDGEDSYFIAIEIKGFGLQFYSITDSSKVLDDIKK